MLRILISLFCLLPVLSTAVETEVPVTVGKDGVRFKSRLGVKYPVETAKANLEGLVTIRVRINETGAVTSSEVLTTSGFQSLDAAAIEASKKAVLYPYLANGEPIRGPVDIPINFVMDRTPTASVPTAQKSAPQTDVRAAPKERTNDVVITKKTFSNGAVFSEYRNTGSLQPNIDIGCRSIDQVSSEINPPALTNGAMECVRQGKLINAWRLYNIGSGFAYYDLKRLADKTALGAFSVVTMNVFSNLSDAQRESTSRFFQRLQADPEQVQDLCEELTRIGPPTYDPQWAILHGMAAFYKPQQDPYLKDVDKEALWGEVLKKRCTPQQIAN